MTAEHFTIRVVVTGKTGDPVRPLTLNAERDLHWGSRGRAVGLWRTAATEAILEAGHQRTRWERCRFDLMPVYPNDQVCDTGSVFPVEKAIIDGAVDMGLIPDDNRHHNAGQNSKPPAVSDWLGMVVRFVRHDPVAGHGVGECSCRESMERSQRHNELRRRRGGG